jgi:hypothetical protein
VLRTVIMKIKCISNNFGLRPNSSGEFKSSHISAPSISLIEGKLYELLAESNGFYQLVDESGESYWHPAEAFIKI